ncbi:HlyD family type I secretion periplasmic adaptor subunit [Synechococcus sp. MU1644]|nr:HlyD family type I secretion periplasmic adaptor subunit [Synechococcus sp. MU1644]
MTQEKLETISKRTSLALPIELEEGPDPIYSRALIFTISALVFALLVWANFAKVRELSVAAGEIVPSAPLYELSHIEGGIVETVFVDEGQTVSAGDPLLKLRPETSRGELQQLTAQNVALEISAERLDAILQDRTPDFERFNARWQTLVEEENVLYTQSMAEHAAGQRALRQQLLVATSERETATASIASQEQQARAAKEQFEIQETLFAQEFTSRLQYLDAESSWLRAEEDLNEARARAEQSEAEITRLESELWKMRAGFRRDASTERTEIAAQLAELQQPLESLNFIADNMTVAAPTDGRIKKIHVAGTGSVVGRGEILFDILPADAPLIAEVQIKPQDIANVRVGQETDLVISSYDPNRFGKVAGEIAFISPGSFVDEVTGEVYFLARVQFDGPTIGDGRYVGQLGTGMTVSAEIVTQRRSIMEYFLKPVSRSVDMAFAN